ncbi:hypothetical protein N9L68_00675 [bacterium]|nr:hypothetical protein [bacterium]
MPDDAGMSGFSSCNCVGAHTEDPRAHWRAAMEFFQFGDGPTIRATVRWTYEVCVASVAAHVTIFQLPDASQDIVDLLAILGFDVVDNGRRLSSSEALGEA